MTYEPRFDRDYPYGRQGELLVDGTIAALRSGQVRVEDKRKRRPDNMFYVEFEHDPGRTGTYRPSGISTTEAELYAFVIENTGVVVFVPTVRLRAAFDRGCGKSAKENDGSCPTHGRLLSFNELIATGLPHDGVLPGTSAVTLDQVRQWRESP